MVCPGSTPRCAGTAGARYSPADYQSPTLPQGHPYQQSASWHPSAYPAEAGASSAATPQWPLAVQALGTAHLPGLGSDGVPPPMLAQMYAEQTYPRQQQQLQQQQQAYLPGSQSLQSYKQIPTYGQGLQQTMPRQSAYRDEQPMFVQHSSAPPGLGQAPPSQLMESRPILLHQPTLQQQQQQQYMAQSMHSQAHGGPPVESAPYSLQPQVRPGYMPHYGYEMGSNRPVLALPIPHSVYAMQQQAPAQAMPNAPTGSYYPPPHNGYSQTWSAQGMDTHFWGSSTCSLCRTPCLDGTLCPT